MEGDVDAFGDPLAADALHDDPGNSKPCGVLCLGLGSDVGPGRASALHAGSASLAREKAEWSSPSWS